MKSLHSIALLILVLIGTSAMAQDQVVSDYMAVKDALVQSDTKATKQAAASFLATAQKEKMDDKIVNAAKTMVSNNDIKVQRTAFKTLTDELIVSIKANGSDQTLFVQYCPMAFNNKGANWLSLSEEIRNPYYGDMMLTCGKVEDKIE